MGCDQAEETCNYIHKVLYLQLRIIKIVNFRTEYKFSKIDLKFTENYTPLLEKIGV